jgi:hypothetical protein
MLTAALVCRPSLFRLRGICMRASRHFSILGLLLALLLLTASSAGAAASWCEEDPIVMIGDKMITLLLAVPEENLQDVRGAATITVSLPHGHPRVEVTRFRAGFFQESVRVVVNSNMHGKWDPNGNNPVRIEIGIRSHASHMVRITMTGDAGNMVDYGWSNQSYIGDFWLR